MKMKVKIILMKAYILFCLFWMLTVLYVLCRVEWGINPEWEKAAFIMIGIWFCLAMLLVYFMPKVDLYPSKPNVEPEIKLLYIDGFENFEKQLFRSAKQKGFRDVKQVISDNNNVEMQIAFRSEDREVTVLQTVWMDEFDRDLLKEATATFWKETEERIGKRRMQSYVIQLIQCIGIPRMDDQANEFVHRNLPQNFNHYQSLNVISVDEKLIYICQTEHKFLEKPFRKLEGFFLEIMAGVDDFFE